MIGQKTTNRDYPLPHADNKLRTDVLLLNDAFVDIDTDVNDLYETAGTLSAELATVTQNLQNGNYWHTISTGNGVAYEIDLDPVPALLNSGLLVHMKAHVQNTGPATLKVNSLEIKTIKKTDGSDLKSGNILAGAACFLIYDGTNFQLINPKTDQAQTEVDASNIMRAFEEIQENHGGSLHMESGWSDSFSIPNEQGADETNSTRFQHDPTNKLYKGTDPGTNLSSDKNYDTESNFLQQEWTNSLPTTGQATVTNGDSTVTLVSGTWPTNCEKGRISFDNGSTWYDINTRLNNTSIGFDKAITEASGDYNYIIRLTNFNTGSVKFNSTIFRQGDDRDGIINLTTGVTKTLDTEVVGSLRSTHPDAIARVVTANPTGTTVTVASGEDAGFAVGDKVILINMQGFSGDATDCGNHEILTVASTSNGNITTVETISKSYDGTTFGNQKVFVQRIPQYSNVTVNHSSAILTCSSWNGTKGGIIAFYCSGTVTVSAGKIDGEGKGFRGGSENSSNLEGNSHQGEGITGPPDSFSNLANTGGGGGGNYGGAWAGGGGASYGSSGIAGIGTNGGSGGNPGEIYGTDSLSTIFLGSGGGAGGIGNSSHGGTGGNGGGIIRIFAGTINTTGGQIIADGSDGSLGSDTSTGSGGGSGGSILLITETSTYGASNLLSQGGSGTSGSRAGGAGGDGRIRLEYNTINTNSYPSSVDENNASNPDPGSSSVPSNITNVSAEYTSICDSESQKTNSSDWFDINSASVTETLDSQNAYYWLTFDPVSNFGDETEIKIFNPTGAVWRKIARNSGGTWEYNNDATDTAAETWTSASTDNMLHAVSQAISTQVANRMTGNNLAAITDTQWEESGGWSNSVDTLTRGLTLYSNSSTQNPSTSKYRLNYDSERGSMDLRSKTYDPDFVPAEGYVWSQIEHSDSDGPGTFYVTKNGGTEWTTVPMTQQGLPLSGDIRIYRGTVDVSGQTSGQDLRCRYETESGKDQFIYSWGLQAKP
jgi:hypothetical protein